MFRRWLIRSILLALCVMCVGVWLGSHFRQLRLVCTGQNLYRYILEFDHGAIYAAVDRAPDVGNDLPGWRYFNVECDPASYSYSYDHSSYHFAGFAFDTTPKYWDFIIPVWFPATGFMMLFWYGWRKTRPAVKGKAFPVEPPTISD